MANTSKHAIPFPMRGLVSKERKRKFANNGESTEHKTLAPIDVYRYRYNNIPRDRRTTRRDTNGSITRIGFSTADERLMEDSKFNKFEQEIFDKYVK